MDINPDRLRRMRTGSGYTSADPAPMRKASASFESQDYNHKFSVGARAIPVKTSRDRRINYACCEPILIFA